MGNKNGRHSNKLCISPNAVSKETKMYAKQVTDKPCVLCLNHYPVFFIDMTDWYEGEPFVTGTITSVADLEDGSSVLLVNDILEPIVSVLATVYYSHPSQEGSVYKFSFYRRDIGVPVYC